MANGKTNTELMRIAYVAMTRPRKLLVVAMPKNKAKLSNRFPPDKWDYVEANNAAAVTIKALPASDSSIGAANGHNSSATSAEAAACA